VQVFSQHAGADGMLSRADFVKLVETEAKASLGKVWDAQKKEAPNGSDAATAAAQQSANAPDDGASSPKRVRALNAEELVLAEHTPLAKLVSGMVRLDATGRTPCVLVAIGKYNPVNLMHPHMFEVARKYIERHTTYGIIGGFMCPMHDKLVKNACRGDPKQAIPGRRRLDMCTIAVADSKWVDVGRWECVQQTGHLDYPEILHRMSDLFKSFFRGHPNCAGKEVRAWFIQAA
jgi:hypothetical protein